MPFRNSNIPKGCFCVKKYFWVIFSVLLSFVSVHCVKLYSAPAPVFSQIVRDMGYSDVLKVPEEVVEITIPEDFNAVYERYNNLLKEGGYDLTPYKGKKCKRYTYLIPPENARANILVYNGKIIGGDISSITIDGIMLPIINTNGEKGSEK